MLIAATGCLRHANFERMNPSRVHERFQRIWTLYLAYCEGGFAERRICDVQLVLAKPRYRLAANSRAHMRFFFLRILLARHHVR